MGRAQSGLSVDETEAQAIWDSATIELILGGSVNLETLRDLSAILSERDEVTASATRQV